MTTKCAVSDCYLPRNSWSLYCGMHSHRSQRHGSPHIKEGVRETALKPYAARFELMMSKFTGHSRATEVALQIATEVLNYGRTSERSWAIQLERMMEHVRNEGCTAADILRRVVIHYMYVCDFPERLKYGINAEDCMIGRGVMRLCPLGRKGKRWNAVPLRELGTLCRQSLYMYARGMNEKWKTDQEVIEQRRRDSLAFDEPALEPVTVEALPASTRYRRKARGVQ